MPVSFDGVCALLGFFYLYPRAKEEFKSISYHVLGFFVVSEIVYQRFFLDFRGDNGWAIYWIYNSINVYLLLALWKRRAHMVIILLLSSNVLLNIVAAQYFTSEAIPESVYNLYPYPAAVIMLLSVFYMWSLSNGGRILDRKANQYGIADFLFRRSSGYPFGHENRRIS